MGKAYANKKSKRNIRESAVSKNYIFLFVTCALIFFSPFFKGLFFERELRIVHIITFTAVLLWLTVRYRDKKYSLIQFKYEYFLFAFVGMYFLTIPFAASYRTALMEGLKYANYLAIYILVRDQVKQERKNANIFISTVIAGVFIMSVVGILNYLGFMNTNGALAGNRVCSTLQYPNTLAAVIGATVFITLSLLVVSNVRMKLVYAVVLNVLLITFVLTFSRAMWLLFPVIFVVFIFIISSDKRMEVLLAFLAGVLPSVIAAGMLTRYFGSKDAAAIGIIVGSVLVSMGLTVLLTRAKLSVLSGKLLLSAVAGMLILFIAAGVAVLNITQPIELSHYNMENSYIIAGKNVYSIEGEGEYVLQLRVKTDESDDQPWTGRVSITGLDKSWQSKIIKNFYIKERVEEIVEIPFITFPDTYYVRINFYNYYKNTSFIIKEAKILDAYTGKTVKDIKLDYKYLPRAFAARLESISLKENSFQARLAFFKDAFRIIKDKFIIGLGGGGWQASYLAYRSYEYWTTQTHSYPIQVWIETGTVGFLIAIVFLGMYTADVYRSYKTGEEKHEKLLLAGLALFIATILAHSLVDFDLSLGAVSIILWTFLALVTIYLEEKTSSGKKALNLRPVSIVVVILLTATSISITYASHIHAKMEAAIRNNELDMAEKLAKSAATFDPYNFIYRSGYARILDANTKLSNQARYQAAGEQIEKAIKYDSYNFRTYSEMALHQFKYGRFDLVLEYLDQAIKYNPTVSDTYMQKMDFLLNIGKYYHKKNEYEEAIAQLKELKNTEQMIIKKNKELERPIKVKHDLLSYIYKANFILDNINTPNIFNIANMVAMYEDFDFDSNEDLLPDLWEIPYQDDKIVEGRIVGENGVEVFKITSDNPSFYIQRLNLSLEPSSRYIVIVEVDSKAGDGRMTVYIGSSRGKGEQFKEGNIAIGAKNSVYQGTFETTDDVEPGNQYLRLFFSDKNGEVTLKRAIIMKTS